MLFQIPQRECTGSWSVYRGNPLLEVKLRSPNVSGIPAQLRRLHGNLGAAMGTTP
jgi:hypothetical protein